MKIIVCHPGKQHSFQLATAAQKAGVLLSYITSVYLKKRSWTKILYDNAKGDLHKKIGTRRCNAIPDNLVLQYNEFRVILTLLLNRLHISQKFAEQWNFFTESSFYKKVMKFAKRHQPNAIIYYNGYARKHLDLLSDSSITKIMDVSIAHRLYLKDILEKEIQRTGLSQIQHDHLSYWDSKMIAADLEGCRDTDYFLVPSNFVKKSLIANGIKEEQIKLVPYGVNTDIFKPSRAKQLHTGEKIRLLYVGSISYRKGIHRLLKVVSTMNDVELTLAGSYDPNSEIVNNYRNAPNILFLGFITRDRLNQIYNDSHIFVLPSFCEGMAMVGLEAMSAGLPIICTTNTGVNDVVVNGINGFVYDPEDDNALREYISWFKDNPDKLESMSQSARETSLEYTWDVYHQNVINAIKECVGYNKL